MPGISRRELLTTASGIGAATMLGGATIASASPHSVRRGVAMREAPKLASKAGTDAPMDVDLLEPLHGNPPRIGGLGKP